MEKRICEFCKREFIPVRHNQKFCSHECYMQDYNAKRKAVIPPRKCLVCGKEFSPVRQNQKYCSHKCARTGYVDINAVEEDVNHPPRKCAVCGKMFKPYSIHTDVDGMHSAGLYFCSFECTKKYYGKNLGKNMTIKKMTEGLKELCSL